MAVPRRGIGAPAARRLAAVVRAWDFGVECRSHRRREISPLVRLDTRLLHALRCDGAHGRGIGSRSARIAIPLDFPVVSRTFCELRVGAMAKAVLVVADDASG